MSFIDNNEALGNTAKFTVVSISPAAIRPAVAAKLDMVNDVTSAPTRDVAFGTKPGVNL